MRWTRRCRKTGGADPSSSRLRQDGTKPVEWLLRKTGADGEAVWSWHPKAGAKLATMLAHRADDGDNKVWLTGESAEQAVKTIAQGRPVDIGGTCGEYSCAFELHTRLRVRLSTRSSLRPHFRGTRMMHHPGASRAAGMRGCVFTLSLRGASAPKQSRIVNVATLDCVACARNDGVGCLTFKSETDWRRFTPAPARSRRR